MARFVKWETESPAISASYSLWRIALVGAVMGAIYWGLTALLNRFINSISISGDIATILIATLGIMVMLRLRIAQPLVIAIATGATLWGLAQWSNGLAWGEIIGWSALLYGLSYAIYSWISRYARALPVLFIIAIIVIATRIIIAL